MIILKWTYSDNEYVSDDGERHDCTLFQHGLAGSGDDDGDDGDDDDDGGGIGE